MNETAVTYNTIIKTLTEMGLHFERYDEHYTVDFGMTNGDENDVKMQFSFKCDDDRKLLTITSILPFVVENEKTTILAIATTFVNNKLAEGCFDLSFADGVILFRYTANYEGSILSGELIKRALYICVQTVDRYNDKFRDIAIGKLSVEDFLNND